MNFLSRRVILVQAQKLDSITFSFADILRLVTTIAQTLLEEEETQISGEFLQKNKILLDILMLNKKHLKVSQFKSNIKTFDNITPNLFLWLKYIYFSSVSRYGSDC